MGAMHERLHGKKGDEFDKIFLADMIVHHQGAVEMAKMALTSSDRQEIKDMARAIIDTQIQEIVDMEGWQREWFGVEREQ